MSTTDPARPDFSEEIRKGAEIEADSAYSDDGVDLTLIRWMLSLTPAERLDALQASVDLVARGRECLHD